jgi:hypothetical protein
MINREGMRCQTEFRQDDADPGLPEAEDAGKGLTEAKWIFFPCKMYFPDI